MEEVIKHVNDTNASYRDLNSGNAKNTDLFLDNEYFAFFASAGEQITVRFDKKNLTQAILFIASILPRKFDQSATHEVVGFSKDFVFDQLALLDSLFIENGQPVDAITQVWDVRKDVPMKNGEIDSRFYFKGLLRDVSYTDHTGNVVNTKFTVRNYLAGGFSDIHFKKSPNGVFDLYITNATESVRDDKEKYLEVLDTSLSPTSLQRIYYGAPGTGKSRNVKDMTKGESVIRTTFHPDSDYSTFVGCYKPTTRTKVRYDFYKGKAIPVTYENGEEFTEEYIVYEFVEQAFLQAYIQAWRFYGDGNKDGEGVKKQFLIIEEINRGNCAQIFGDLFQLLDRNEYGFSDYYIHADNDMRTHLEKAFQQLKESGVPQKDHINAICNEGLEEERREDFVDKVLSGEILLLPNNLYIWATMNTSDQSLFPIDSAFKRRWDWEYVPIKDFQSEDRKIKAKDRETGEIVYYDWGEFMEEINKKIYATTNSADKQLGYFFCDVDENKVISTETFVNKVVFYLWNDVFKDFGFSDDIFADKYDKENSRLTFDKFFKDDKVKMGELVSVFMENLNLPTVEPPKGITIDEDDNADDEGDTDVASSQKDRSKYFIEGEGPYNKGELVRKAVELYIDKHPSITVEKLIENFKDVKVSYDKIILNKAEYEGWLNSHSDDKRKGTRYQLVSKDGVEVYVTTQIRLEFMEAFIKQAGVWGYTIKKAE